MSKRKHIPKSASVVPVVAAKAKPVAAVPQSHVFRETVESIVIAFVLAFLFRTFQAEAFVIPTGSMAPTLMGRHKDVDCPQCGYRYTVTASDEEPSDPRQAPSDCIAGQCPMCRYVLAMRPDLPSSVQDQNRNSIVKQPSYNGDRILVNKYVYTFTDPDRWDVVVFKYPGDAKTNYIKRLVGLPGESLRIDQGDLFIKPPSGSPRDVAATAGVGANRSRDAGSPEGFGIERKPAEKFLAMRQQVHDTEYDPVALESAGWPLRWHAPPGDEGQWELEKQLVGKVVHQTYRVEARGELASWLRYEHVQPLYDDWQVAIDGSRAGQPGGAFAGLDRARRRRLITDANPYNERISRSGFAHTSSLQVSPTMQGLHWVGDLMVEADVAVESKEGELLLDLVEGGKHFTCMINLASGEAKLSIAGEAEFARSAKTALVGPGGYRVAFANVDDQLLLWVDGKLVEFAGGATYDAVRLFGERGKMLPQTSDADLGDLAPVGIGAREARLRVSRLQVWRDVYYIADSWERIRPRGVPISDFHPFDLGVLSLAAEPTEWGRWAERKSVDFELKEGQLFVMGDNSAESSDARLWFSGDGVGPHPGGAYLDQRLLIGKALCVYWPHSWNRLPGTPIPFPLFPNVADMRIIR
ncbi:MAG: signal peptidase I [Pirellulales bacterium]|nr:signal peptidase I [Pirellulales bacterium]